jgi:hypothetical protein
LNVLEQALADHDFSAHALLTHARRFGADCVYEAGSEPFDGCPASSPCSRWDSRSDSTGSPLSTSATGVTFPIRGGQTCQPSTRDMQALASFYDATGDEMAAFTGRSPRWVYEALAGVPEAVV